MTIDILTTFPSLVSGSLSESIMKRAQEKGCVELRVHDLRKWTSDKHRSTDAHPYGGGPGMVMMIEPIDHALTELQVHKGTPKQKIIVTSAKGSLFTQQVAHTWAQHLDRIVFICGHYEGIDERVAQYLADEEIRIGNYVLTGGELAATVMTDTVVRLLPGVLGDDESSTDESFTQESMLEYPQYTRPENYKGWGVPRVLLEGHHKLIEEWRNTQRTTAQK